MFIAITAAFVTTALACGLAMMYRFGKTRAGVVGSIGFFWWAFAGLFRIASYVAQFDISSLSDFFQITYVLGFAFIIYAWATIPIVTEAESTPTPMPTVDRPRIVTIIGSLLIILAIIGLLALVYVGILIELNSRNMITLGTLGLGAAIQAGMGIGILAGMNWVRIAYFVIAPASILIAFAFGRLSSTSVIQIVMFGVAAYCLSRPAAIAYFHGGTAHDSFTKGSIT